MIVSKNLPNQKYFPRTYSSFTADEIAAKAKVAADKAREIINKREEGKAPESKAPDVKPEKLILGMHPLTLLIASVSALLGTALIVVAVKHFKK
jgi:hypothetical protein